MDPISSTDSPQFQRRAKTQNRLWLASVVCAIVAFAFAWFYVPVALVATVVAFVLAMAAYDASPW